LRIREKIMVTFIVLLVLPPVVMMTVSSARLTILSNQNADDSSEALLIEELDHLERIASDEAQKINELFDQIVAEVTILDTYSEQLIDEDIMIDPYLSYWWDDALELADSGRAIPGIHYDADYDSNISYNVSCYYMPRDKITSSLGGELSGIYMKQTQTMFGFMLPLQILITLYSGIIRMIQWNGLNMMKMIILFLPLMIGIHLKKIGISMLQLLVMTAVHLRHHIMILQDC